MSAHDFRRLHDTWLTVPNAWDAASARVLEAAGAKAVATSSAALAWAHGVTDGQRLPFAELLRSVTEMVRVLRVPLSIDLEQGYSDDPRLVAEIVTHLVAAGAVGVNLEDGGASTELLVAKIRAIRGTLSPDAVFVNARTCVVLRGGQSTDAMVEQVIERGRRYAEAGADGFFVPMLTDAAHTAAVVSGVKLPLNVMASAKVAEVSALQKLGVRRLSVGPRLAEVTWSALVQATRRLLEGDVKSVLGAELGYPSIEALMKSPRSS